MQSQLLSRGGGAGPSCSQAAQHVQGSARWCTARCKGKTLRCVAQHATSQDVLRVSRRGISIGVSSAVLTAWAAMQAPHSAIAAPSNSLANSALMQKLQQRLDQDAADDEPSKSLLDKFAEMQMQLQRVQLLVQIKQYDSARMQLRNNSFKSLRLALGYGSQRYYPVITPQMTHDVLEQLERLDGALKRKESPQAVKPIVQQVAERLQAVTDAISVVAAEAR